VFPLPLPPRALPPLLLLLLLLREPGRPAPAPALREERSCCARA